MRVLYLICKMLLIVNYFAVDEGKSLICRRFTEAETICVCVEFDIFTQFFNAILFLIKVFWHTKI